MAQHWQKMSNATLARNAAVKDLAKDIEAVLSADADLAADLPFEIRKRIAIQGAQLALMSAAPEATPVMAAPTDGQGQTEPAESK